jgi:hypothetical protein
MKQRKNKVDDYVRFEYNGITKIGRIERINYNVYDIEEKYPKYIVSYDSLEGDSRNLVYIETENIIVNFGNNKNNIKNMKRTKTHYGITLKSNSHSIYVENFKVGGKIDNDFPHKGHCLQIMMEYFIQFITKNEKIRVLGNKINREFIVNYFNSYCKYAPESRTFCNNILSILVFPGE